MRSKSFFYFVILQSHVCFWVLGTALCGIRSVSDIRVVSQRSKLRKSRKLGKLNTAELGTIAKRTRTRKKANCLSQFVNPIGRIRAATRRFCNSRKAAPRTQSMTKGEGESEWRYNWAFYLRGGKMDLFLRRCGTLTIRPPPGAIHARVIHIRLIVKLAGNGASTNTRDALHKVALIK